MTYIQLTNEDNELLDVLMADPLLFVVFVECARRARRIVEPSPLGLLQFEFFFSQYEYSKFGLMESQRGRIPRLLITLESLGIIQKTDRKIGHQRSNVYRYINNKIININPEIDSEIDHEQITNRSRIDPKKNDKNVKNDKNINTRGISEIANEVLGWWNKTYGKKFKATKPIEPNLNYWLEQYSLDEIKRAITNSKQDDFWSSKLDPTMFFRQKNPTGERVDRIGQFLNMVESDPDDFTPEEIAEGKKTEDYLRSIGFFK